MPDSSNTLIDSHVSTEQLKRAVNALLSHALKIYQKKQDTELLPAKEESVWLVVAVKTIRREKKLKPRRMYVVVKYFVFNTDTLV